MACEYGWRAAPPTLDGSRRSSSCRGSPSSYLAPFNQLIRSVFRDARATHLESLVVHLQREQTELHAKIDRLLQHQGVASVAVAPEEDELAA
jgi:hypothetical protein